VDMQSGNTGIDQALTLSGTRGSLGRFGGGLAGRSLARHGIDRSKVVHGSQFIAQNTRQTPLKRTS